RGGACLLHCRDQQSDEDRADRNDHQELDQGKSVASQTTVVFHLAPPGLRRAAGETCRGTTLLTRPTWKSTTRRTRRARDHFRGSESRQRRPLCDQHHLASQTSRRNDWIKGIDFRTTMQRRRRRFWRMCARTRMTFSETCGITSLTKPWRM